MTRFLNRILGLPVGLQNKLFNYFTDTLGALIQQAKRMGKWDNGILGMLSTVCCVSSCITDNLSRYKARFVELPIFSMCTLINVYIFSLNRSLGVYFLPGSQGQWEGIYELNTPVGL